MLRPRELIEVFGRQHPGCWDALREVQEADPGRPPPYVFATIEQAGRAWTRAARAQRANTQRQDPYPLRAMSLLPGLAAWRLTQTVYRFDPDLYAALLRTPVAGPLPGDLLQRLPGWCVWIDTPGMDVATTAGARVAVTGIFAWVDRHPNGHDLLCVAMDAGFQVGVTHLRLAGTVEQGLASVAADWQAGAARGTAQNPPPAGWAAEAERVLGPVLSLLLYLCADAADYTRPPEPAPRRIKGRVRLVPPERPTMVPVGERLGAALRRAAAAADPADGPVQGRARPQPHVRAAHWHTFLRGPRTGERRREVRWLPPIGVRVHLGEDLAAVVRRVK